MSQISYLECHRKMPLMWLPVRTTVLQLQLQDQRLMISPGSTLTRDQLASAGAVTDLVIPNLFHTDGAQLAKAVFPNARIWDPVSLADGSWPYGAEVEVIPLEGMPRFQEFVFYHRESRTLIVTDLFFNLLEVGGFGAWMFLHLFGTYKVFAISRLLLRFVVDRNAFEQSLHRIMALPFEQVVMAHGAVVTENAKQKVETALRNRGLHTC